jgi:hypothetical protein
MSREPVFVGDRMVVNGWPADWQVDPMTFPRATPGCAFRARRLPALDPHILSRRPRHFFGTVFAQIMDPSGCGVLALVPLEFWYWDH